MRAFTLSAIMHQHGLEYDVLLANFDVRLERFKAIPKRSIEYTITDMLKADPDQIAEDVAAGEGSFRPEGFPFRLPDVESETERDRGINLFAPPRDGAPGLLLWLALPPGRTIQEMDAEARERLKALGYVGPG